MNFTHGQWRQAALALLVSCCVLGIPATAQALTLRETSVPIGILDRTTQPGAGTLVTTLTAPDQSTTFRFVEWTLNGVRFSDATAAAANPCSFTITTATDAVAIYMPAAEDADADALPDWWERRYFGTLQYIGTDNPDLDANNNAQEYVLNTHPGVYNPVPPSVDREYAAGGVSRRRSVMMPIIQDWTGYGILRENSQPAGAVMQERIVPKGVAIALSNPPSSTGGYRFTGWLKNGTRFDAPLNFQPISVTPTQDIETYTARYISETADTDADGVLDWREWLNFESLQYDSSSDPDGDGFAWAEEDARGFSTLAPNELAAGGISRRRSQMLYVDTTGRLPFRQTSNPATILEQTEYLPPGTLVTVPNRAGNVFANYQFCYWTLNGIRQEDASGIAVSTFSFTLNTASTALAVYIDPTVDTDNDGIKDWREFSDYGTLANDLNSDTDGDGFTYADEMTRNQSPRVSNELAAGGISRRRSQMIFVDSTGRLPLRLTSNPATILEQTDYYAPGTTVNLPEKNGHTYSNYRFTWWDLNGQRLQDPSGVALTSYSFPLTAASTASANYIDPNVDTDNDGIKDWNEWTYYGSLQQTLTSDTDDDGFSYADELARGQSPRVANVMAAGGVSRRRSLLIAIDPNLTPTAPEIGSLFATDIGSTSVTLRALVNPMSAATTANFNYGLTASFGSQVASTSVLNGFSSQPMDAVLTNLQPGATYHFQVMATNSFGTSWSLAGTFTTLSDYFGYDAWQLANGGVGSGDSDHDGDGVSNLMEYAFGMNPRNSSDASLLPRPELADGRLRLRYSQSPGVVGITYGAEWTSDLVNWYPCTEVGYERQHVFWTPTNAGADGRLFTRWVVIKTD
jgi:hypothetical protein